MLIHRISDLFFTGNHLCVCMLEMMDGLLFFTTKPRASQSKIRKLYRTPLLATTSVLHDPRWGSCQLWFYWSNHIYNSYGLHLLRAFRRIEYTQREAKARQMVERKNKRNHVPTKWQRGKGCRCY